LRVIAVRIATSVVVEVIGRPEVRLDTVAG
jgi:hypothetical protein